MSDKTDLGSGFAYTTGPTGRRHPVCQLISREPLHVEPSIQTYTHDMQPEYHGFIRNGKWESA
jgi:hypothetical protein